MGTAGQTVRRASRATGLIGRDREVRELAERIDAARDGGCGALLIRGPAGIGKSSLLEVARAHAAAKRFQILATTGIQAESNLPFAGLHQLLRPVLAAVDRLPETYGNAVRTAFSLVEGTAPSPFQIALAILHLLAECAESAPVVLLVDDAQWLDRSTADVLAFVARRLEADAIVLIVVVRDGFGSPLLEARLPELTIERLSKEDAATLLDARALALSSALRDRVLSDAAGNPLALVELSAALEATNARLSATASLPLTDRLERAFADRLSSLTPGTRSFLQVAATDEKGMLAELLSAASKLEGREVTLDAAAEAGDAELVEIDGHHLRFRHPLMRSAIHQAMSPRERQAAHAALAATLDDDPDRRAWHRAAAALGNNEEIAADLEAAATRASKRGAKGVAFEALERAAQFTDDPERRGTLLIQAAYLGTGLGRPSDVLRILEKIDDQELRPLDRPHAGWLRELYGQGSWSGASRIASFAEIADQKRVQGDIHRGLDTLSDIALRCWWSNPDEETRRAVLAVVERFPVPETEPLVLYILAMADPVECGAIVLDRLSRRRQELPTGPLNSRLGGAALAVGDFVRAERFLEAHILFCRAQGLLGALTNALVMQAWTKIPRGDWKSAGSMASEAARLAEETGQGDFWKAAADLASATIAAYRGEIDRAERLAAAGEQTLLPRGATPMLALVQLPRGAAALAAGRHDEAYHHLRRIFDASDSAYHPHVRSWALVDLVEAAVHSGHEDEALGFVNELEPIAARSRSPLLEAAVQFARPALSPDSNEPAFQAGVGLASWPFTQARLQLAHGLWLRRQRRAADARAPLRAARDMFDALGAVPWSERARQELRASGETSRRRTYDLTEALSPQELQIAQLAAAGLSNKEIGRQLFLSHRTIGSHLYRIFPKLGITARSHLNAALQSRSTPSFS